MAVHHQMRECLEFYHQQRAGEQGESQTRHSFYCLHLRLGSKGGHCCLSADLCRLDFPPFLARSPSAFFSALFFWIVEMAVLSFFFFEGILSFLSRSFLYLRPDAPKAGTKDKCYTIPGRGMERWWGWGRGFRSVRKKRKNGHALFCEPGGRPGADG